MTGHRGHRRTTAAARGTDSLDLTEAVPTGPNHRSYLALVLGVLPDDAEAAGNPASGNAAEP